MSVSNDETRADSGAQLDIMQDEKKRALVNAVAQALYGPDSHVAIAAKAVGGDGG